MKIFDFNIHLPDLKDDGVNDRVATEIHATNQEMIERLDYVYDLKKVHGGNFMVFNSSLFMENDEFAKYARSQTDTAAFTLLIDFRAANVYEHIEAGIAAGINCIKFHSYHQQIDSSCYPKIIEICKYAEEKGLIICLDGSYGTSKMIQYDIVDFICTIADAITKTTIIVLHSGGLQCLKILLLALEKSNIYLETSLTLPWYEGSSIEQDLAFMYKKMEDHKILFATDSPYIPFQDGYDATIRFFEKHGFSSEFQEGVFYHNAIQLLNS
ncbi:MAG: amidohydrolase family protein [Crocinitomicaceae bacterium]